MWVSQKEIGRGMLVYPYNSAQRCTKEWRWHGLNMCGECVVDTFTLTCSRHLAKHIANTLMHSGRCLSNTNKVQDIWGH